VAIILGLGLTDILRNIGEQVRRRHESQLSTVQLLASILLLQVILTYLWQFWAAAEVIWTLPLFLLQTAAAVALALCAQFIRVDTTSARSAEAQYWENCALIYASWAAAPLLSWVFLEAAAANIDSSLNVSRFPVIALLGSLALFRRKYYHLAVLALLLAILVFGNVAFFFELMGNE
jgi:hypothetical protein